MLTDKIIKWIELPHEPGEWIEARMPSLSILVTARRRHNRSALEMMEGIDWPNLPDLKAPEVPAQDVRLLSDTTDWLSLLGACITAWSYEEPVTLANIEQLDEQTVEVLLIALLSPGPGLDHIASTLSRKNNSGRSTKP